MSLVRDTENLNRPKILGELEARCNGRSGHLLWPRFGLQTVRVIGVTDNGFVGLGWIDLSHGGQWLLWGSYGGK